VPNYLTEILAGMSRFHDRSYDPSFRRFSLDPDDSDDEETYPTNKVNIKDHNKEPPEDVEVTRRCLITPPSLVGKRIK
jgi:hypothetical protein